MDLDKLTSIIRKLAKSNYYQSLYAYAKQELDISLFQNRTNLTHLQLTFLTYLSFYHELEGDVHMGEIDDRVMENFIYEDAYMMYRSEERKKMSQESYKHPYLKQKDTQKEESQGLTKWVFQRKK